MHAGTGWHVCKAFVEQGGYLVHHIMLVVIAAACHYRGASVTVSAVAFEGNSARICRRPQGGELCRRGRWDGSVSHSVVLLREGRHHLVACMSCRRVPLSLNGERGDGLA